MQAWAEFDPEVPSVQLWDAHGNILPFRKAESFDSVTPSASGAGDSLSRLSPYAIKRSLYDLYMCHPVVYAAVELIQQSASLDDPTYSDPKHPLTPALEAFFANVGPAGDIQSLSRDWYRDLAIAGESFILKQRKGRGVSRPGSPTKQEPKPNGSVVGLKRLIGSITIPIADKKNPGTVSHYEQRMPGTSKVLKFDPADVIFGKLSHPDSEIRGLSPLMPLDMTLGTDMQAGKAFESYFSNGMQAGKVFKMTKGTREQAERNKEWIQTSYTRPENAFKPMLLMGDIDMVKSTDQQMDMPFLNGRQHAINLVCAVYSIPRSKLFSDEKGASSLGKAAHETDDVTFRRDTIAPYQIVFVGSVNRDLMTAEFRTGDLLLEPPMQQLVYLDRGDIAESATRTGWTGNEIRTKIYNLPPIEDPEMDKPQYFIRGVDLGADIAAEAQTSAQVAAGAASLSKVPDPNDTPQAAAQKKPSPFAKAWRYVRKARSVDDSEDDDDEEDAPRTPPSKEKQRKAAILVHGATVGAGTTLATLLEKYSTGKLSRAGLERAVRETQHEAIQVAVSHAAQLSGVSGSSSTTVVGGAAKKYTGPSVDRIMAIADKLANGAASPAQAEAWAQAEAGAAWTAFQREKLANDANPWMLWERDPGAMSCEDCLSLDGETKRADDWDVAPGDLTCSWRCRCNLLEVSGP